MIEQGDPRLLDDPVAQRPLHSTELARLAYMGQDGLPRLIPMLFHGTGTEIMLRPSWVGLLDFQTRVPRPMAGALV